MIKHPPARKHFRRNSVTEVTPRLAVSFATPPITATFRTQFPDAPIAAPDWSPVTLNLGDPPVIQVDMEAFFAEAVQFIIEHPVLCTAIAAGIVWVICAGNQPSRPAYS
jgi:hypothetical protein